MTELRDQFAMAALTGMLAAEIGDDNFPDAETFAHAAYQFADAMLVARAPAREPTVDDLDLSVRTANILHAMGIETITQFMALRTPDLKKAGAGAKTIREVHTLQMTAQK